MEKWTFGNWHPVLGACRDRRVQRASRLRGGNSRFHHVPHPEPVQENHLAAPGPARGHARPERGADPGGGLGSCAHPRGDPGHHWIRYVLLIRGFMLSAAHCLKKSEDLSCKNGTFVHSMAGIHSWRLYNSNVLPLDIIFLRKVILLLNVLSILWVSVCLSVEGENIRK